MDKVLILLATYNGEKYIDVMINSVLNQDYSDIQLVLSDDGSKDATPDILERYAMENPEKVVHYKSGKRFGNAQAHFMHLLEQYHDAPYIMFCDQDDFWHSDKVSKTIAKMKEIEVEGLPAMVHTDLCVVDANLDVKDPSFLHFSKLNGNRLQLNKLLVQNVVTGCTMMINNVLADLSVKNIPQSGMLMHDWWLALIAAACGKTGFVDEATIDYRQHGNNVVGAKNATSFTYILKRFLNNDSKEAIKNTFIQAKTLYDTFGHLFDEEAKKVIGDYAKLSNKNFLSRRINYLSKGYLKSGFARKIGQMIWG